MRVSDLVVMGLRKTAETRQQSAAVPTMSAVGDLALLRGGARWDWVARTMVLPSLVSNATDAAVEMLATRPSSWLTASIW